MPADRERSELACFFSASLDILCVTRADGSFEKVNPAFEATLGYTTHEILTQSLCTLLHPDDVLKTKAEYIRLTSGESVLDFVNRCRHKDGSYRWLEWRAVASGDKLYAAARDVTARIEIETELAAYRANLEDLVEERTAELRTLNRKLQEKNTRMQAMLEREQEMVRLQRQFVATVSHEFRTPLAVIDGSAHRMIRRLHQLPPEQFKEGLEKCRRAVARLTALIESVLSSSRLEAGTIGFKPASCQLIGLLSEVCQNQQEICSSHTIISDISGLQPEIVADAKLLHQVFANLLSNAAKYSPGSEKIWVEGYMDGSEAVVAVRDKGLGIPKDELDKLCGRFFRASTSAGIAGNGIGLHLVKSLIEMHRGRIEIESVEGSGSTFTVRLPADLPMASTNEAA